MDSTLQSLTVLLTGRCNLDCAYCYRDESGAGRLTWPRLRPALDWALARSARDLVFQFTGGEPLLEIELLKRAVAYVRREAPGNRRVGFELITNGLLLVDRVVDYLDSERFRIQLSHDGVPAAQAHRGRATFDRLEEVLERLRSGYPDLWASRLAVAMTVHPENLALMAASVQYFLAHDVRDIGLAPVLTPSRGWDGSCAATLVEQFDTIFTASLAHHRRTGRVPVDLLRRREVERSRRRRDGAVCNAVSGTAPAVDVDGTLYACLLFAEAGAKLPAHWRDRVREAMRWGRPDEAEFDGRRKAALSAATSLAPFNDRDSKRSSTKRCAECSRLDRCQVCPLASLWLAGEDARRVPDFLCAFNRTAAAARERFPALPVPTLPLCHPATIERRRREWLARAGRPVNNPG